MQYLFKWIVVILLILNESKVASKQYKKQKKKDHLLHKLKCLIKINKKKVYVQIHSSEVVKYFSCKKHTHQETH